MVKFMVLKYLHIHIFLYKTNAVIQRSKTSYPEGNIILKLALL